MTQPLPKWVKPQLARLADEAPAGKDWLHEVKYDGYRMRARMESGRIVTTSWRGARHDFMLPRFCL